LIKSGIYITIALLLLATIVEGVVDQKTANQIIAEKYIGECGAVAFTGADAFQSSDQIAIIFKIPGFQGPIEAMIILSNNEIEKLLILKSNEGLDKSALDNRDFLESFEQKVKDLPLEVDAIAGATITSQIVIDEMNRIIKEWNKKNE
jgi:Na+-translocating ferredoxin:NAD+ oxidoreductase RnfG subunit